MQNLADQSDALLSLSAKAQESTWLDYHRVIPNVEKSETQVLLSTQDQQVVLDEFDDAVLQVILEYTFAPLWLLEQWYDGDGFVDMDRTYLDRIREMVQVGLVWVEPSVTGEYIRPTSLLFTLYDVPFQSYKPIPFNQLTHTISEEQVMLEVLTGRNACVNQMVEKYGVQLLPRWSPLGIRTTYGTNIIPESQFRVWLANVDMDEINQQEYEISQAIQAGKAVTPELTNFRKFIISKKLGQTGNMKKDWKFHVPDLIVPVPRVNGKAQSIALEVELTNKYKKRYVETLQVYQNNNRYGSVVWMCNEAKTAWALKDAYQEIGGLKTSIMRLDDFVVPHPRAVLEE